MMYYIPMQKLARWGRSGTLLDNWPVVYDSNFGSYLNTFGTEISSVVTEKLALLKHTTSPTIVDLMSSTAALYNLANLYFPGKRINGHAFGLSDQRSEGIRSEDENKGILMHSIDLRYPSRFRQIGNYLEGQKIDLLVERSAGGLDNLPCNNPYYGEVFGYLNSLMSDTGLMVLQLPSIEELKLSGVDPYQFCYNLEGAGVNCGIYSPDSVGDAVYSVFWCLKTADTLVT